MAFGLVALWQSYASSRSCAFWSCAIPISRSPPRTSFTKWNFSISSSRLDARLCINPDRIFVLTSGWWRTRDGTISDNTWKTNQWSGAWRSGFWLVPWLATLGTLSLSWKDKCGRLAIWSRIWCCHEVGRWICPPGVSPFHRQFLHRCCSPQGSCSPRHQGMWHGAFKQIRISLWFLPKQHNNQSLCCDLK